VGKDVTIHKALIAYRLVITEDGRMSLAAECAYG
jgi:hypothetical protein